MLFSHSQNKPKDDLKCVVRVQTEAYKRGNTYFYGKSIRVLKGKTTFDFLHEESQAIGIQDALENILNLDELSNGVYEFVIANQSYDIESGYLDDWGLRLIPYIEENP